MANSFIITKIKNTIVKEFIRDEAIVKAIDSPSIDPNTPEKLINSHIFTYHQNPFTLDSVGTFLTLQVHVPTNIVRFKTHQFVSPSIEIWVISHFKHMVVDNISKITANRNDYLSQLIDEKLNGKSGMGIGKLVLVSNVEGSFQEDYLYRKLTFEGLDLNDSMCEEEET